MSKIGMIISREYSSRVKKRSFLMLCILGPIVISLFAFLAIQVSDSYKQYKVIVVDPEGLTGEWNTSTQWCSYERTKRDITDAEFADSKYDILIYVNRKFAENNKIQAFYKEKASPYARADILREFENRLEGLKIELHGINPDDYYQIKTRVRMGDKMIDGSEVEYEVNTGTVGFVFGALIFFFIFNFGVQVMRGVIEEKSSRIVEVIISSVKPIQLMTGKIVGIGLAALTQFIIWTSLTALILIGFKDQIYDDPYQADNVAAAQTASSNGPFSDQNQAEESHNEPYQGRELSEYNAVADMFYRSDFTGPLLFFAIFLIFGYLFYAGIYASIGSAVDNDTDVQQFLFPVTLPLMLGFVVAWLAATQPGSDIVYWFSLIPFTSPIVMMVRAVVGIEPGQVWQLYLSIGILITSACFMFLLAARIYKTGILMYGKKASFSELWRWAIKGE